MSRHSPEILPRPVPLSPSDGGSLFSGEPLVVMRGIRKAFGPVEVLHGVNFEVMPGEVHALAGENGAGKSTLIKILSGVYDSYSGEILVGGTGRRFSHPMDALRAGIATIHQELSLVPSMSIADNLFLGCETTGRFGTVNFRAQEAEAARILESIDLDYSPATLVEELPLSVQQLLEIGRALTHEASVLILDEPTSALNEQEAGILFDRIFALRSQGTGIVYITHRMEEIYRLADRITVLRDGSVVGTSNSRDLPPRELVRWMVGRDLSVEPGKAVINTELPALEVENLNVEHPDLASRFVVEGLSFTLRRGEILGLAGLQGAGTSEVLHALFGALGGRASGQVRLCGEPFVIQGPTESVRSGLVLLTNDRKALGLAPDLGVVHNASLACLSRFCNAWGWVRRKAEVEAVSHLTQEFGLSAPSLHAPVNVLSGGNQQKVYLARWLLTEPRVLLLDEPTRGVDVGAKSDIYGLIREWVGRGMSILLITSEMEELLALSDRILVMHRGRLAAEFEREAASKDAILTAAMGQLVGIEIGGRE